MLRKVQTIAYVIAIILWFFICQYLMVLIGKMMQKVGVIPDTSLNQYSFLLTFLSYILCIAVLLLFEKMNNQYTLHAYKLCSWQEIGKYIVWSMGLWLLMGLINGILLPFFPAYNDQISELFDAKEPIFRFLTLVVGAPFVEEFIFRGKIQKILKVEFGKWWAVVLQGLIFGMIHPFGLQRIYASVMGMSFGFIREKTDNLVSSTLMHMMINLTGWIIGILTYYKIIFP